MRKQIFILCLSIIIPLLPASAPAQTLSPSHEHGAPLRSFNELFPSLAGALKNQVFSKDGLVQTTGKGGTLELIPSPSSGIQIHNSIIAKKPTFLAESLLVVPYSGKTLDKLDAYNALGKIRDLKGRLYSSYSKNSEVPLFEDATRLESAKKTNPIPDPPPARELPLTDTVFIRLKDVNFGNSFYKAEFSTGQYGVSYNMSNFKSLTYLFFTVMKEDRFSAILYLEPLAEGMLVYSVAGADASDFIASKINIPTAIGKRLKVFINWVSDGLVSAR